MKHINTKLTRFPFIPLFENYNPLPPPPMGTYRRILPDGTYRIYFDSLAQEIQRIVEIPTP